MGCKTKLSLLLTCETEKAYQSERCKLGGGGGVIMLQGQTGKFFKLYPCSPIRPSVKYGSPSSIKITF